MSSRHNFFPLSILSETTYVLYSNYLPSNDMFVSNVIWSLLFSLLCSPAFAVPRSTSTTTHSEGSDSIIIALLRTPPLHHGDLIRGRQTDNTCKPGHHQCSDGIGCCPTGQNCGVFQGKGGCCPEGKTCVTNSSPCQYAGYVLCFGENFCCPEGDICSRDSSGNQKCTKPGSSSSSVPSTLSMPMITQTSPSSPASTPNIAAPSMASDSSNGVRSITSRPVLVILLPLLAGFFLSSAP